MFVACCARVAVVGCFDFWFSSVAFQSSSLSRICCVGRAVAGVCCVLPRVGDLDLAGSSLISSIGVVGAGVRDDALLLVGVSGIGITSAADCCCGGAGGIGVLGTALCMPGVAGAAVNGLGVVGLSVLNPSGCVLGVGGARLWIVLAGGAGVLTCGGSSGGSPSFSTSM